MYQVTVIVGSIQVIKHIHVTDTTVTFKIEEVNEGHMCVIVQVVQQVVMNCAGILSAIVMSFPCKQ